MVTKVAVLLCATLVFSCKIDRCPEEAPDMEFYKFDYAEADTAEPTATDTLTLVFQFEDCQGDVGIPSNDDFKNLQTELFVMTNGEWEKYQSTDSTLSNLLHAQVPEAKKLRRNQHVEGTIEQPINNPKQFGDTIRFETVLYDAVGNASQNVVSPTYIARN